LEDTALVCAKPLTSVERLMPDGSREAITFRACEGGRYQLDLRCEHLDPAILLLR